MIAEALTKLEDLATKAAHLGQVVTINQTDYLFTPDGITTIKREPEPRDHSVHSMDSFLECCKYYGEAGSVWYSPHRLVLLIDDARRFDRITLQLDESAAWTAYADGPGGALEPAAARRWLAREFYGFIEDGIPARFGKVDFRRRSDGSVSDEHGKETLGKSVEKLVSNADTIPDKIMLRIPRYRTIGCDWPISVCLFVDISFEEEAFRFSHVKACVEESDRFICAKMRQELEGTGVRSYYGTP